jgi:hypothetical protein
LPLPPSVRVGEPLEGIAYKVFEQEGIEIYIPKDLNLKSKVRISLKKFLFFKELVVVA